VRAVGLELCPELGIAVPVGKDSLSMKTVWRDSQGERIMRAPVSLIVSAFAPVTDAARSLTPLLDLEGGDSRLLLVDLGNGRNRLGGSCVAQVHGKFGREVPDLDRPEQLKALFETVQGLNRDGLLQSYHDRSDGGLIVTLCEMAFATHCGLELDLTPPGGDPQRALKPQATRRPRLGETSEASGTRGGGLFNAVERSRLSPQANEGKRDSFVPCRSFVNMVTSLVCREDPFSSASISGGSAWFPHR